MGDVWKLLIIPPAVITKHERAVMIGMFRTNGNRNGGGPDVVDVNDRVRAPLRQEEKQECRRDDISGEFLVRS